MKLLAITLEEVGMERIARINPVARAIGVIAAVAILATSVTFAALQSSATLTNSSINSATASLLLYDGDSFESTAPGFTVTGLVPGTGTGDLPFYFQNAGGVPLDITAHVPTAPSSDGFSGWENLKVTIKGDDSGEVVNTDFAALLAGQVTLPSNPLPAGAQGNSGVPDTEGNYSISFDVLPSSITGSQVTVGNFDIVFTGTQPAPLPG